MMPQHKVLGLSDNLKPLNGRLYYISKFTTKWEDDYETYLFPICWS